LKAPIRKFATTLLTERLDPAPAAAAVFWGVFIGIVPIYGLQTLAALGVAILLRLNKPLILASTFINNPLLQPLLVISSVELGGFLRHGSSWPSLPRLRSIGPRLRSVACVSAFASSIAPLPKAPSTIVALFAGRCGLTGFFPCWPPRI
jgi:uncharacterized protein (DUF2062 family)